jgi:hypothetical protein
MFGEKPPPQREAAVERMHADSSQDRAPCASNKAAEGGPVVARAEQILAELKDSIRRSKELIQSSQKHLR